MSAPRRGVHSIEPVTAADLTELLGLMRAYCEFYETAPGDDALLALARALLADPKAEGLQLIARAESSEAVGFATLLWSWDTTVAGRVGIMHDLYVAPRARGGGVAEDLIDACVERAARRGAVALDWETAPGNLRAQAVYDRVGAGRTPWIAYRLEIGGR